MDKVEVIILAAGKSTRMKTDEPKALAQLHGKPFLQHILATIEQFNKNIKPIIVIGHKKERIKEVMGAEHLYAEQAEQLGTGHAVMSAEHRTQAGHKTVIILSTDQPLVSSKTLQTLLDTHEANNAVITLATSTLSDFNDWRSGLIHFGRIIRSTSNKIEKIVEFRDANEKEKAVTEVNPAIYAFDAKWLWQNLDKLKNNNTQKEYYLTDLIGLALAEGRKVATVPIFDIIETLQPNSLEELDALERLAPKNYS